MKKRPPYPFIAAALAMFLIFAGTDAMAFCDYCSPSPATLPMKTEKGGWTVELVNIEKITSSEYFRWTYRIYQTGTTYSISGLNFAALLIPDCCREPYVYIDPSSSSPTNLKTFPVAEGEPTIGFGKFIESGYVIKGTPDNSATWSLVTSTNAITMLPAVIKSSSVITLEIPGPACSEPTNPYSPEIKLEEFYIQEIKIRIEWNATNPCDAVVSYLLPGTTGWISPAATDILIENSPLVECGPVEGNQKCQRCRFTTQGSPTYTYIKVGSKTYKICICDCPDTPVCTN
ncbi:MAG: hypothetical protein R6V84_03150 [Desulfobacterales bacterium]